MDRQMTFEFTQRPTIKGFPELRWTGKRPYRYTQYYPAQLRERYGEEKDGWINKIFWGDNLQVMSHMMKEFHGKIDLIYIDPPFDSKADYKKKIEVKGIGKAETDSSSFEEKQYSDIWINDEYLQFMYERLVVMRELLADSGVIYVHCDWHKSHHLRMLMDEVFGADHFLNEVVWQYYMGGKGTKEFAKKHDNILVYVKNKSSYKFNKFNIKRYYDFKPSLIDESANAQSGKDEIGYWGMVACPDVWQIKGVFNMGSEYCNYPTQKPEALIERILTASTDKDDIVFDCFMGSGTTQAVAMKLGRRFIGADINLGAIQTTTKRLLNVASELNSQIDGVDRYTGFEVYNVNNYDLFRNPIEARDLILQALEVQPFESSNVYDGEKDGRMVKIMPVNRIATKADLQGLLANLPYKQFEKIKEENPSATVLKLTIVCMGHEPDLAGALREGLSNYKVDIEVVDILHDRADLQFKRDAEADIAIEDGKLVIKNFFPLNLMQKLSLDKETVEEWRQLVESVMIDFNYDGAVLQPTVQDIPEKNGLVKGVYPIPKDAGTIRVKITDVLSESLEVEVKNG